MGTYTEVFHIKRAAAPDHSNNPDANRPFGQTWHSLECDARDFLHLVLSDAQPCLVLVIAYSINEPPLQA